MMIDEEAVRAIRAFYELEMPQLTVESVAYFGVIGGQRVYRVVFTDSQGATQDNLVAYNG